MNIEIGPAQQGDLAALQGLFREENQFHAALVPEYILAIDDVLRPEELADFIEAQDKALFVAKSAEQLVGAIIVILVQPSGNRWERQPAYGYIDDLIVQATARGQGLGTRLMEVAIQWVESQGVSAVELHVWESNHQAIRLYESLQFRPVQRRMKLPLNGDRAARVSVYGAEE
jgi:ribosomal protein S18 acetylase RimI-like enzyme